MMAMKMKRMATILALVPLAVFSTAAQQSGSLEFSTRVTPSAGRAEPARGMSVFLLRKSFADIQKEAEADEPKPDLAKFVEEMEVDLVEQVAGAFFLNAKVTVNGKIATTFDFACKMAQTSAD